MESILTVVLAGKCRALTTPRQLRQFYITINCYAVSA